MNATEILRRARALIIDPKNWCTGRLSREKLDGNTQYCVLGAINKIEHGRATHLQLTYDDTTDGYALINDACRRLFNCGDAYGCPAVYVNNELGHDAIILALDTAIGDYPDHAVKELSATKRQVQHEELQTK